MEAQVAERHVPRLNQGQRCFPDPPVHLLTLGQVLITPAIHLLFESRDLGRGKDILKMRAAKRRKGENRLIINVWLLTSL